MNNKEDCPVCGHSIYNHGEWISSGRYYLYRFDHSEAASTQFASFDCKELDCRCKLLPGDSILEGMGIH